MSLYGLIIGIACVILVQYFITHNSIIPKNKENIFIFGLLFSSLIGARAYHVVDKWSYYSQNLIQIFNTRNGGLAIYGALIFGFIYIFLFSKIHKLPFIDITNLVAPIVPLCQSLGRLGNFFNHEISIWWLESLLCFLLFLILKSKVLAHYSTSGLYLIGYGLIRLLTESFRSDTWTISPFKIAQLISIIFITVGTLLCLKKNKAPFSSQL